MKPPIIIAVDPAARGSDYTAEVEGYWHDGKFHITDLRRFKDTIDLEAADVTDQKLIETEKK